MVHTLVIADEVAPDLSAATLRDLAPDLVLAAGDLPWEYVEWVGDTASAPVVFVPGNHDPETRRPRGDVGLRWEDEAPGPRGAIDADGRTVEVRGLRIAGLGGCVRYRSGPHQYTQRQYARAGPTTAPVRALRRPGRRAAHPRATLRARRRRGPGPPRHRGAAPGAGQARAHLAAARPRPPVRRHVMPDRQVGRTTLRNVDPVAGHRHRAARAQRCDEEHDRHGSRRTT